MSDKLNQLLDQLNNIVERNFTKSASSKKASRKKAQEMDTTSTEPLGEEAFLPEDDEMENSVLSDRPVEEAYDPEFGDDKNLEEERVADVASTGEKSVDDSVSGNTQAEKAAALANKILKYYQKKAEGEMTEEEMEEEEGKEEEEGEEEESEKKKEAGYKKFFAMLKKGGAPFLRKCAAMYDKNYQNAVEYYAGQHMADAIIKKEAAEYKYGAALANKAIQKEAALQKEAQICKNAYNLGAQIAERTIMKLAADLVAIQPVLQNLYSQGILTQEEKDALTSALASADVLTPEVIQSAVQGLANSDEIAAALLQSLQGTVAPNIVPEMATNVMPTPSSLPGGMSTLGSPIPPATTLDVTPEKAIEQKAQELLNAVNGAEQKKDENMIIQAAQAILKKRNRRR